MTVLAEHINPTMETSFMEPAWQAFLGRAPFAYTAAVPCSRIAHDG